MAARKGFRRVWADNPVESSSKFVVLAPCGTSSICRPQRVGRKGKNNASATAQPPTHEDWMSPFSALTISICTCICGFGELGQTFLLTSEDALEKIPSRLRPVKLRPDTGSGQAQSMFLLCIIAGTKYSIVELSIQQPTSHQSIVPFCTVLL
jgi:hypothetical protein